MLDSQRQRASILRDEVHFTRRLLISHLLVGFVAVALLASHGLFRWALAAGIWYLVSIFPLIGMLSAYKSCRHTLGLLFLLFSFAGVFVLTQVRPTLTSFEDYLLPPALLPLWLGVTNILYFLGGLCLILNRKIRRSVTIGFTLW